MRRVTIAAVQPPSPGADRSTEAVIARGLDILKQAGQAGADAALLPEYFNVFGLPPDEALRQIERTGEVQAEVSRIAAEFEMHVVLPMLCGPPESPANAAVFIGRDGGVIACCDKVHITAAERRDHHARPGGVIPVLDLDFGRAGVMICYDVYFPEHSRILGIEGAEVIFFPTLQRSEREDIAIAQVRIRAMDSFAWIVRSTYAPPAGRGRSCIVAPDGSVVADAGLDEGMALAVIDLDEKWKRPRSHGEPEEVVRDFILHDRRPELYGGLCGHSPPGPDEHENA